MSIFTIILHHMYLCTYIRKKYEVNHFSRSHDKEQKSHEASSKPRLFTYCGRTVEGVQAVLDEVKKNAANVEFQALIQDSALQPTNQMPYRGFTVINAANQAEEIQVMRTSVLYLNYIVMMNDYLYLNRFVQINQHRKFLNIL